MDRLPRAVTLRGAAELGVTKSSVRHRVQAGRWQRVYRDVYATHSGPLAPETRLQAALAYAGAGAALSHETAAVRLGLRISPVATIHVTVPATRRVRHQEGLVVHYARRLSDQDLRVRRGLACTSIERTVLDLVSTAKTEGKAAAVIVLVVGSRRTTADRLRHRLQDSAGPLMHRRVAAMVLAEAEAGAHSPLELRFSEVCRSHGLPEGTRQVRRLLRGGKAIYLDNLVEEYGLVTELDGHPGHDSAVGAFRDNERDNANVEAGLTPVRAGWENVLDDPCEVARQRAAILVRLGWPGQIAACSPGCSALLSLSDALATPMLTKTRGLMRAG
jgi:hypothetical protein